MRVLKSSLGFHLAEVQQFLERLTVWNVCMYYLTPHLKLKPRPASLWTSDSDRQSMYIQEYKMQVYKVCDLNV